MQSALMEKTMDYESFAGTVKRMVKNRMGKGYDVRIHKVIKNNSLELDSLVVLGENMNAAPNIYLKPYYEAYLTGISLEEICDRLCTICSNCSRSVSDTDFTYTLKEMKPYIFYRLVSFERNSKLLQDIPHIPYLDLALTFHCLVKDDEDGIGTIRITNDHRKLWGISLPELKELAVKNTERLFPASIKSMEEVLMGILADARQEETGELSVEDLNCSGNTGKELAAGPKMYILSNQKGINGAACMLYRDVIRQFSRQMNSDLYILPSSIHEIILIPKGKGIQKEVLNRMVEDVNRSQVSAEEVLSDRVYIYSREGNSILM